MGSPSSGAKGVQEIRADHLEPEQAVHRPSCGLGRRPPKGTQCSGDARREKTLPNFDPIGVVVLPRVVVLPHA